MCSINHFVSLGDYVSEAMIQQQNIGRQTSEKSNKKLFVSFLSLALNDKDCLGIVRKSTWENGEKEYYLGE